MSGSNVLVLHYMDVNHKGAYSFTESHAENIISFINDYRGSIETIVCACDSGISRSSGICIALMEELGQDPECIWNDNYYRPNIHVYKTMKKVLEQKKVKLWRG